MEMIKFLFTSFLVYALALNSDLPASIDDLWLNTAYFKLIRSFPVGSLNFSQIDAGTRVVVVNGTWFLFGRVDTGPSGACTQGVIAVNVRSSEDEGSTWTSPHPVVTPDLVISCLYADGTAFFDRENEIWHYLVQVLNVGGQGGWMMSHFSTSGPDPFGTWKANPSNPVVHGGQLFDQICSGSGKHCQVGMIDEGTPEIVEKRDGKFYVTFHGYDYNRKAAARGVARTPDFVNWEVSGDGLPDDVIFSAADCNRWNVSWAAGGCIGSGESSTLRGPSGALYQVIEAADVGLECILTPNTQWWPLGIVRSNASWQASPSWAEATSTPFMTDPHVGCSLQYNSFWLDDRTNSTWWAVWGVNFVNQQVACSSWHIYQLVWGSTSYPMSWPGC